MFSNKAINIYHNPKKIDISVLEEKNDNDAFVIIDKNLKNTTKTKKAFDSHLDFWSISCYKLNYHTKKNILDSFLKKEEFGFEKEAYWFFLEYSSDRYGLFENNINNIIAYNKKNTSLEEVRYLLSNQENEGLDKLFFSILLSPNKIIKFSRLHIGTVADAFSLIFRIKFYLDILIKSKDSIEANNNFPKYLFTEKENFISIYKKTSYEKISLSYELIKKTDLMLKKNNNLYFPIIQRFILNLRRSLV